MEQDLFVAKNSFKLHLNRIYILRDGLDPEKEHTLSVRISEKRNELSKGNNCRVSYFGLNGNPRTPKGVGVDGAYFNVARYATMSRISRSFRIRAMGGIVEMS